MVSAVKNQKGTETKDSPYLSAKTAVSRQTNGEHYSDCRIEDKLTSQVSSYRWIEPGQDSRSVPVTYSTAHDCTELLYFPPKALRVFNGVFLISYKSAYLSVRLFVTH